MEQQLTRPDPHALEQSGNIYETGFGDPSIGGNDLDFYKGTKGRTDRLGILAPTRIVVADSHFQKDVGSVLCQSEFKMQGAIRVMTRRAVCCEHLDEPKRRIGVLVIHYDTKSNGQLVEPFGFKLKVWRVGEDKFVALRNIHNEWPLDQHDLLVNCEDEQWQRMAINVSKQSIYQSEAFQKLYGDEIRAFVETTVPRIKKAFGKKLTTQELLEKLGKAKGPAVVSPELDSPVADITELLK